VKLPFFRGFGERGFATIFFDFDLVFDEDLGLDLALLRFAAGVFFEALRACFFCGFFLVLRVAISVPV